MAAQFYLILMGSDAVKNNFSKQDWFSSFVTEMKENWNGMKMIEREMRNVKLIPNEFKPRRQLGSAQRVSWQSVQLHATQLMPPLSISIYYTFFY